MSETNLPAAPAPKPKKVRGTIYVNALRCKGCGFCIQFCPPRVLEFTPGFNPQGYHFPHLAKPDGCTGCDLCGLYCPDFAIYGVMLKDGAPPQPDAEPPAGETQP